MKNLIISIVTLILCFVLIRWQPLPIGNFGLGIILGLSSVVNFIEFLKKSMAKSLAIKTGQTLNEEEQEHIVNSLFACKEPNISPFNKRTYITLTKEDLDNKFN